MEFVRIIRSALCGVSLTTVTEQKLRIRQSNCNPITGQVTTVAKYFDQHFRPGGFHCFQQYLFPFKSINSLIYDEHLVRQCYYFLTCYVKYLLLFFSYIKIMLFTLHVTPILKMTSQPLQRVNMCLRKPSQNLSSISVNVSLSCDLT